MTSGLVGAAVVVLLLAGGPLLLVAGLAAAWKEPRRATIAGGLLMTAFGAVWTLLDAYLLHWFFFMPHSKGRLLRIGGKSVRATAIRSTGWIDEGAMRGALDLPLSAEQRQRLAAIWTLYASMEHASVPAFGRLAESLVRSGAPAALVRRAHEAALDEIRHAQRCYAVASALSEAPVGPGPLAALDERPARGARDQGRRARPRSEAALRSALADLAHGSLRDGALAEGVAASNARTAARQAHPWLRDLLDEIAADEARHAQLGADVAAWCMACDPSIAEEIPAWIAAWKDEAVSNALLDHLHEPWMEAYGVLAPRVLDTLRAEQLAVLASAHGPARPQRGANPSAATNL